MWFYNLGFCFLRVLKTENVQYSGAYAAMGVDNSLRLDEFRKKFRVEVVRLTEDDMEFDLVGVDASLANAFRRILIAEVILKLSSNRPKIRDILFLLKI